MNANRSFWVIGSLALSLLAMSLEPTSASAQVYRGKFTLPFAANWSGIVLTPGEYSFSLDKLTPTAVIEVQRDGKYLGFVVTVSVSDNNSTAKSELIAIPDGAVHRISVLRVHDQFAFNFLVPKNERKAPAQGPELTLRVPVSDSKS